MITSSTFLIGILLIVAAINLRIIISTRLNWLIKVIATTATLFAVLTSYVGVQTIYGYPYHKEPNGDYTYLAHTIEEPDVIYVWLIPAEDALTFYEKLAVRINGDITPRVYTIIYTREKHEQFDSIGSQAKGQPLDITITEKGTDNIDQHGIDSDGERVDYVLPNTTLPDKNAESAITDPRPGYQGL